MSKHAARGPAAVLALVALVACDPAPAPQDADSARRDGSVSRVDAGMDAGGGGMDGAVDLDGGMDGAVELDGGGMDGAVDFDGGDVGDGAAEADASFDEVEVSAAIGPSGGTLEHPGGATLTVPAGALDAEVTFSIRSIAPPATRGFRWVGPVYRLGPSGQTFAVPVTLTLPWDEGALGAAAAAAVRVYHGTDRHFAVPSERDESARLVTGSLASFSEAGPGVAVADRVLELDFAPRDLSFTTGGASGYLWVMGPASSPSGLPGAYLYRVDAASGTAAPWVGESEVFPDFIGPTFYDGWGVWAEGGSALFVARVQNGTEWTVNQVSLAGSPDLSRSYFEVYRAPASGTATTLVGVTRNATGTWAPFAGCGQLFHSLAPASEDPDSTGPCPSRPPVLIGNRTVRFNDCNYASSPGREFFPRFGSVCTSFVDFAPSATSDQDVVATDANHRVVYIARNASFPHSTVVGVTGLHGTPGYRDGPAYDADDATRALLSQPRGVAVAADGTIYVADRGNHAVRRITAAGALAWGTVTTLYGGPEAGALDSPESVALEPGGGALWIADSGNHRLVRVLLP